MPSTIDLMLRSPRSGRLEARSVPMQVGNALGKLRRLSFLLVMVPLGACGVDRIATASITPEDYRVRHPMVLTHQNMTLDIFPQGRRLDRASRARIKEFAATYKDIGEGPVTILLPRGTAEAEIDRHALGAIRRALVAGGAPRAMIVDTYPVPNTALAAAVRISFVGLKAVVASRCGQWPDNLASGAAASGWENRPYWNQGCAYQTAFAAQVADPRDLVSPRAESPGDVQIRTRAIRDVRKSKEPGTKWTSEGAWAIKNADSGQ